METLQGVLLPLPQVPLGPSPKMPSTQAATAGRGRDLAVVDESLGGGGRQCIHGYETFVGYSVPGQLLQRCPLGETLSQVNDHHEVQVQGGHEHVEGCYRTRGHLAVVLESCS